MTDIVEPKRGWGQALRAFLHPKAVAMLFLGFSAGVPILLIFSSLSLWLSEAGLSKSAVTMFSWAALGYSFKFVWAPLIDRLPVPVLTRVLGRRRAWILVSQAAIIGAICLMALTDPATGDTALWWIALGAVLLGFSSATQDIVIDAYRIEAADKDLQAMLSATYIAGYRIGMVIAGAGALFIADMYGSTKEAYNYDAWRIAYLWMAGAMGLGVLTTLIVREPEVSERALDGYETSDYLRFLLLFALAIAGFLLVRWVTSKDGWGTGALAGLREPVYAGFASLTASLAEATGNKALAGTVTGTLRLFAAILVAGLIGYLGMKGGVANRQMVSESYVEPVRDFFRRYGMGLALLLLALVGLYRISDIVLGVISNVFYQDVGFSKTEIATISKAFGVWMGILGGFLGGFLAFRYGVLRILFLGAVLSMATNLLFVLVAQADMDVLRAAQFQMPAVEFSLASVPVSLIWVDFDRAQLSLLLVIAADNIAAGLAGAAFVAFLSSLTNISFTAMQYAIFSSLMTLLPKIIGGYSGTIVEATDYSSFFMLTFLMGIPVLVLIWLAGRKIELKTPVLKTA